MKRRAEREQAFLLIFERSIHNNPMETIIENAGECREMEFSDFATKTALGVEQNEMVIDQKIENSILGWKMNRLSKVSLALMRLAIYEMMFEPEIPIRVSINEVIDLAKKYGGREDAPFINGVLGTVAKEMDETP